MNASYTQVYRYTHITHTNTHSHPRHPGITGEKAKRKRQCEGRGQQEGGRERGEANRRKKKGENTGGAKEGKEMGQNAWLSPATPPPHRFDVSKKNAYMHMMTRSWTFTQHAKERKKKEQV